MDRVVVALAGGAVVGALAGLLTAVLGSLRKDLRDQRFRRAGVPVPSDRVFGRYHWPCAVWGALQAGVLVLKDVPTVWAVLSALALPAAALFLLIVSALFTWLGPSSPTGRRPPLDFDPGVLVGMELREAMKMLTDRGWRYRVVREKWGLLQPPYSGGYPYVRLTVDGETITKAEIVEAETRTD